MEEIDRLARLAKTLQGVEGPAAGCEAACAELGPWLESRDVRLEVRVGGSGQVFGAGRSAGGGEVFLLRGRGPATVGAFVVSEAAGRKQPLAAAERAVLEVAAGMLGPVLENMDLARRVAGALVEDALTGCLTRREGMARIAAELERARTRGGGASLIFLDVDCLKDLNDRYGHGYGDSVLAAVGAVLGRSVRGGDVRCRYGGDEFVVLLRDMPSDGAVRVAASVLAELAGRGLAGPAGAAAVGASCGVSAAVPGDDDAEALVARADAAMYRAKRAGGNAVQVWQDGGRSGAVVPRHVPWWRRAAWSRPRLGATRAFSADS